jgi:hypothetical protein
MTSSVDSRISPKRYESLLSEIEDEDQNIRSELYELSIYDHTIMISPGKTIEDEEIKDLVYCYVYAVKNDKVVQKLGVYERFTKEKEEFFDLSTFGKGTLCLFEKYETNPSLFLEFKTDEEKKETKKKPKSKKTKPETVDPNEVDLNAEEPETKAASKMAEPVSKMAEPVSKMDEPASKMVPDVEPEVDPNEVDLNAEEPKPSKPSKPVSKTPDPNEVDLNAPTLLDVEKLEKDLGIETAAPKKTKSSKIKLKAKTGTPKAETPATETPNPEPKPETKPKARTKKTKTADQGEAPGTKFG